MERERDDHLKDMVFRGAFFVVLVYLLVFLYNSGVLNRLTKTPTPQPIPAPSPTIEPLPVNQDSPGYNQPESSESPAYKISEE